MKMPIMCTQALVILGNVSMHSYPRLCLMKFPILFLFPYLMTWIVSLVELPWAPQLYFQSEIATYFDQTHV